MSDLTNTSNRAVNGSVSTVEDSMNSSTQAVHGSSSSVQGREVVSYTYRDNANDYPNNIQSTNLELNQERPITSNNPKDVIIKDGIFDRILSSIKSLDDKSIELNKSYRRKFYWHFWEKTKVDTAHMVILKRTGTPTLILLHKFEKKPIVTLKVKLEML